MTKNPHLVRADQYLQLFMLLSAKEKAAGKALDVFLENPTSANKKALDDARDAMNKTTAETIKKYNELKEDSRRSAECEAKIT